MTIISYPPTNPYTFDPHSVPVQSKGCWRVGHVGQSFHLQEVDYKECKRRAELTNFKYFGLQRDGQDRGKCWVSNDFAAATALGPSKACNTDVGKNERTRAMILYERIGFDIADFLPTSENGGVRGRYVRLERPAGSNQSVVLDAILVYNRKKRIPLVDGVIEKPHWQAGGHWRVLKEFDYIPVITDDRGLSSDANFIQVDVGADTDIDCVVLHAGGGGGDTYNPNNDAENFKSMAGTVLSIRNSAGSVVWQAPINGIRRMYVVAVHGGTNGRVITSMPLLDDRGAAVTTKRRHDHKNRRPCGQSAITLGSGSRYIEEPPGCAHG